jgi:hypothetical protein
MTNQEWIEMFRLIPDEEQNQLVLVLLNGSEISVDVLFRYEPNFLVLRGRVAGTTDEGRAFFVPYDQMLYYRIERVVNVAELREIVCKGRAISDVVVPAVQAPASESPVPTVAPSTNGTAVGDAAATRNALLDRIRAARATQSSVSKRDQTQ